MDLHNQPGTEIAASPLHLAALSDISYIQLNGIQVGIVSAICRDDCWWSWPNLVLYYLRVWLIYLDWFARCYSAPSGIGRIPASSFMWCTFNYWSIFVVKRPVVQCVPRSSSTWCRCYFQSWNANCEHWIMQYSVRFTSCVQSTIHRRPYVSL